jgi:EmrB/QacA subfamily drug resistance transporter
MSDTSNTDTAVTGHPRRWLILYVILVAECMDLLDSTIVNVAAPAIRAQLDASTSALQWIVGGYPLAIAVGLIAGGRLGDLYGRRRMFVVGTAGFTVASMLCAVAWSPGSLIAFRLLQGLLGAVMLPQGLGLLRAVFPPSEMPKAFSVFGPVLGSAAVLGPIIGGALIAADLLGSGWRLVFLVNLPLGIAAIAGTLRWVPESRPARASRLDLTGMTLVSAAAVMLVFPLIQGRELGWPAWTYASMALSFVVAGTFVLHQRARERSDRDPLIALSVFSHRGYSGGLVVAIVFFSGMIGSLLVITLFMQLGEGFSAIRAGVALIPFTLGIAIGAGLSGAVLAPRFGRSVLQAGGAICLAGWLIVIAELPGGRAFSAWDLVPGLLVAGIGIGLIVAPLFDIILAAVTDAETGSASGVLNATQQLASAIGVAALGTIFFANLDHTFTGATERALWTQVGLLATLLLVSPLLPRHARESPAADGEGAAAPPAELLSPALVADRS